MDPWSWDQYFPGQGPFQYYDLFTEDAAWQQALEAVHVIRLYPVWQDSHAAPDQLETVPADIQRRGIAISYEAGPLTETERCNAATVEGFWGVPGAENIVRRIADAGEVRRLTTPIEAGPAMLAETITGANGEYQVALDRLPAREYDLIAWYPGSDAFWPTGVQTTVQP